MIRKILALCCVWLITLGANAQADLALNPVITSPTSACYMSNAETITTTIVNTSGFPYSGTLEVGYILNGGPAVIENQTIGFMPGSGTFIYSFPNPDDFSSCDTHYIQLWVYDLNDPNNLNDTINTYVLSDCDPIPGWISATQDTVCIGMNSGEYNLNGTFGNVVEWGTSTDGGSNWTYTASVDTFFNYLNVSDSTYVEAVVQSPYNLCPQDTSSIYVHRIDSLSDAGILPPDFDICDNGNSGAVWSTGFNGTPQDWLLSTDNGGTWTPMGNNNDSIWFNNLTDTVMYQFITQNGVCPADTAGPVTLTLIPGTAAGVINGTPIVCNFQNNDSLIATGGTGQVIAWWYSVDSGATWLPTTQVNDSVFNYAGIQTSTFFAAEWQLGSCPSEWSAPFSLTVLPIVSSIIPDTTITEGDVIQLFVNGGDAYLWWPDQFMDDPNISNPTVNPDADITYFVQIEDNINGCYDTAQVVVTVLPDLTQVVIPNLFTPNSDGYNDIWEISNIDGFVANELTIFNIYGQVIYTAAPYNNDWGGTYNGNQLPDGTYFYLLNLNDPLYPDPIQGVITIAGND